MNAPHRNRRKLAPKVGLATLLVCLCGGAATSQRVLFGGGDGPEAEFHLARMVYSTFAGGGSRGFGQPWWAIDYPYAEIHFLPALRRLTNLSVADDSRHIELTDDDLFEYPFLFVQQVGQGNWRPTDDEAERHPKSGGPRENRRGVHLRHAPHLPPGDRPPRG